MSEVQHLYVHIPFCRTPCAYCDFASEPAGPHARAGRVTRYLKALREELEERATGGAASDDGFEREPRGSFETIYLGGGTPTIIAPELLLPLVEDLASRLKAHPGAEATLAAATKAAPTRGLEGASGAADGLGASGATGAAVEIAATLTAGGLVEQIRPGNQARLGVGPEFTVEANPGTIDVSLLQELRAAGVTRLSLGVQSFAPALRVALGRRVSQREIEQALAAVARAGWEEWNIDLIFGIPGQTWDDAAADIDAAVAAQPTHISLYDLTYTRAFRTRVDVTLGAGARRAAGAFAEQHYAAVVARLEAAGYRRYEVSNFALPGHECRHNQAYWRGEDYLGVGVSAVSTLGGERCTNPRSVGAYLAGSPAQIEVLSPETKLWEKAMLGLRTSDGVEETVVLPVVDPTARDRLLAQGCLERRYGKLLVNPGFLDVSNTVIGALLIHPGES